MQEKNMIIYFSSIRPETQKIYKDENTMRYHLIPENMAIIKKAKDNN